MSVPRRDERARDSGLSSGPSIIRVNPVAKVGAAFLLGLALLLTIDWVSAAVALALESVLFAWCGLSFRTLAIRTAPVWMSAPLAGITTALYGRGHGSILWQFGFVVVTEGSLSLGAATTLRVLAVGLPAIVLFLTIDPTDLADGLGQVVRLPSRFVVGGLAGLRLVAIIFDDWRALGMARRARGIADSGFFARVFRQSAALVVISIRRGSKLATAMEAKGFGGTTPRTWARPSRFGVAETVLLLVGTVVAAAAIAASVWAGTWNFIGK